MCGTKLEHQENGYNCKVGYKYTPRGGARARERGDGLLPSSSKDGTTARKIQGRACYVHDERVGSDPQWYLQVRSEGSASSGMYAAHVESLIL